ncbi:MAG TPA: VCBS repeat-containing protein, partial [Isosphaeraceae bacterium]
MPRGPRRPAPRRRVDYLPRVDWLEARTLLAGDPFAPPPPFAIDPGPAPGDPGFVGPVRPAYLAGIDGPPLADDPDPSGLPTYQAEREPNDTLAAAQPIAPVSRTTGVLTARDADVFAFTITEPGLLTARVQANDVATRLSLLRADGRPLISSDGEAPGRPDDVINLHLDGQAGGTTYFLKVERLNGAALGTYVLTAQFQPASPPFRPIRVGDSPTAVLTGDFNGDGRPDLIATYGGYSYANEMSTYSGGVTVLLGTGDGTFRDAGRMPVGRPCTALLSDDFDGDGHPDLVATYSYSNLSYASGAAVLLGAGDGTFRDAGHFPVRGSPGALLSRDFNGDGHPDLVATYANYSDDYGVSRGVTLLLGLGDGTFQDAGSVAVEGNPIDLLSEDFDGDGRPDLAVTYQGYYNYYSGGVTVLLGQGDGTLQAGLNIAVGGTPRAMLVGEFNGDGRPDLAVAYGTPSFYGGSLSNSGVTVLLGLGDGTFQGAGRAPAGGSPEALLLGEFNGDGHPDLAVAASGNVTVLLGHGDGTLQVGSSIPVGGTPEALLSGEFNGDGHLDLAVTSSGGVTVLLGRGNGTFRSGTVLPVGGRTRALLAGDFNSDGRPDLAAA